VVVVRAGVFVAGIADEDRAGHEFVGSALRTATEAAGAHVGDGEPVVQFRIRSVSRSGPAPVVDDLDLGGVEEGGNCHLLPFDLSTRFRHRITLIGFTP
jgi:hypothetical protein